MKLSSWPEIGSDGDVLLTPYVPKGITGHDDDDDDVRPTRINHKYRLAQESPDTLTTEWPHSRQFRRRRLVQAFWKHFNSMPM